jgi:hypothetical protein
MDGEKLMYKKLIINSVVGGGLMCGLLQPPAFPETYTGGVSQEISGVDMQEDLQPETTAITVNLQTVEPQLTRVNLKHKLSAIGITANNQGLIEYVDPSSSVYGQIVPGDYQLSIDGIPLIQAWQQRMNYGNSGTYAIVTFQKQSGEIVKLSVLRQPVTNFSTYLQSKLLPYRAR